MKPASLILLFLSGSILMQCDETGNPIPDAREEFLPMPDNAEWSYLFEYTSDGELFYTDTVKHFIKGDTIFEGIHYKVVEDEAGNIVKVVRKKGHKYYGRNHELYLGFTREYLFLDEDAPLNSSWKHYKNERTTLTEYKVVAIHSTRTLNNIQYENVMELEVNYYYLDGSEFKLSYSTKHYYARGVGEIYTYYPSGSFAYTDLNISLLSFNP